MRNLFHVYYNMLFRKKLVNRIVAMGKLIVISSDIQINEDSKNAFDLCDNLNNGNWYYMSVQERNSYVPSTEAKRNGQLNEKVFVNKGTLLNLVDGTEKVPHGTRMVLCPVKTSFKYRVWPHWLAAVEVCLLSIVIGLCGGWTSPYLAKLTSENSTNRITESEASWVASYINIGRTLGAVMGGISTEYIGSKKTVWYTGIPLLLGWVVLTVAESVVWIYVSRVSFGIGMGMFFACFPLYIGEIADPSIRGALVSVIMNGFPIGNLLGNVMGPYMDMITFSCVSLVLNIVFLLLFVLLPDSPHFLIRHDRIEEATKSIEWYHRGVDVPSEVLSLKDFVQTNSLTLVDKWREINTPRNRKSLLVIGLLFIFMQLSGVYSIVYYMEILMREAKVTVLDPAEVVIISSIAGIVSGWISVFAIDRCGRKVLLTISTSGVAVSIAALGVHYTLLTNGYDPAPLQALPIASMCFFQLFVCIGIMPIPSTILSEMFAPNVKGVAAFVASITSGVFAFLSSKTFQPLVDLLSTEYVLYLYAIGMLIFMTLSLLCVPETKGKSLQDIQKMLENK
ncbi:facilitated trehalose transporter Tret1 [Orussus abietinus]|uniref:facilitated trehalose transporter Tret1 n=1 Tax=Orussus abietinus TaxID=222816 RepID=UPI0006252CFC|nr:facilitated trehalose transporter Tret1 [Orussus abietinus]